MIFKTEAVVLRKNKISEADVILTLFTRKCGKVRAVAKGGRKPKTKLSPASHLFVYGEFILHKGKDLDKISSIDINESFYKIREDLNKLAYASYFAELSDLVIVEGVTNNRLFDTLLKALHIVTHKSKDYDLLKLAFEIKVLDYSGLRPQLKRCVNCDKPRANTMLFSYELGGIVCSQCKDAIQSSFIVNDTTIKVIEYILDKDLVTLSKLRLDPTILKKLENIFQKYIHFHLEKKHFKSLEFLNTIRQI